MPTISISQSNIKMGNIPSVSLPAEKTCRNYPCKAKCYARKLERLRPTVRNAYENNLHILQTEPDTYWREVEGAIMLSRFFRFHVSGDIPDQNYLLRMKQIAKRNPHCELLCFTKQYQLVNDLIGNLRAVGSSLPNNLHLILSAWPGLPMDNPHSLPEAHVLFKDGTTTARPDAFPCSGNCADCARTEGGCWTLKDGEQVVFKEH